MNSLHPNAEAVAKEYIGTEGPLEELGWGIEGVVYTAPPSAMNNAVKVHSHIEHFKKELAVYHRLYQRGVTEIQGFAVPKLVKFSSRLRVIEMTIVKPPFLLDFAQTTLDHQPGFVEGTGSWWLSVEERFGERFPVVQSIFYELAQKHGIYYWDLKPGNIEFG